MSDQNRGFRHTNDGITKPPAYPFTGRDLFGELRHKLAEELGLRMTIERLAALMGTPMSTTHHWFETCPHPHVRGFMCLLERLSSARRRDFIEQHCRIFPTFSHPELRLSKAKLVYLLRLLQKHAGLTLINGTVLARTFLLTSFGHSLPAMDPAHRSAVGMDLHIPNDFVPVETLTYVDGSHNLEHAWAIANKVWPRILISKAPLVLLNSVWSSFPAFREDILRLAESKHVVMADMEMPDPADLRRIGAEVHVITVSESKHRFGKIRVKRLRKMG